VIRHVCLFVRWFVNIQPMAGLAAGDGRASDQHHTGVVDSGHLVKVGAL